MTGASTIMPTEEEAKQAFYLDFETGGKIKGESWFPTQLTIKQASKSGQVQDIYSKYLQLNKKDEAYVNSILHKIETGATLTKEETDTALWMSDISSEQFTDAKGKVQHRIVASHKEYAPGTQVTKGSDAHMAFAKAVDILRPSSSVKYVNKDTTEDAANFYNKNVASTGAWIAGHNIRDFDMVMANKIGMNVKDAKIFDTLEAAKSLVKLGSKVKSTAEVVASYKQEDLAKAFGIEADGTAHVSDTDVRVSAQLGPELAKMNEHNKVKYTANNNNPANQVVVRQGMIAVAGTTGTRQNNADFKQDQKGKVLNNNDSSFDSLLIQKGMPYQIQTIGTTKMVQQWFRW